MHRSFVLRVPVLILAFTSVLIAADVPTTKPAQARKQLFWKVTSPTTELYFLGSIHAGSADFYPLPTQIESAFADAKALVVELDISAIDQAKVLAKVMQKGMYPPGDSLDKHLSPKSMELLRGYCEQNGLPAQAIMNMKPGLAITTAVGMALQKMGLQPELGVDRHFIDAAHKGNKRIIELETIDAQLDLLLDLDDAIAEASLVEDMERNTPETLKTLVNDWKAGNDAGIEKLLLEGDSTEAGKRLMEKAIYARNVTMTAKVTELLKGREKIFVTVGSAHLLGDRGILKSLEKAGFRVERPEVTAAPAGR